jgi:hypothetical protein
MKTVIKNSAQFPCLHSLFPLLPPVKLSRFSVVFASLPSVALLAKEVPTRSEYIRPNPTNFCGTAALTVNNAN